MNTTPFDVAKARRQIAADLPPELQEADEILARYGRWAMDRFRKQRCASAEGHYSIPPNDDDREPKEIQLQAADVVIVNRALLAVPDRERIVLHVLYIPKRLPPQAQLRTLRIPPRLAAARHMQGVRYFWNVYQVLVEQDEDAKMRQARRRVAASLLLDRMLAKAEPAEVEP